MNWRGGLTAAILLATAGVAQPGAEASSGHVVLRMTGAGGTSYVVTAAAPWKPDWAATTITGGHRYAGVVLELAGRPARDGLTAAVVRMSTGPGSALEPPAALGAVNNTLPAGTYRLVIVGDGKVTVSFPLAEGGGRTRLAKASSRKVTFADGAGSASLAPQPTGLYDGHVELSLPVLATDPLAITEWVLADSAAPHLYDSTACLKHGTGACDAAKDPTWGIGERTTSGGREVTVDIWDGADGLAGGQRGWVYRGDYRSSAGGAQFYAATIMVAGVNR